MKLLKSITLLFFLSILSLAVSHFESHASSIFYGIETQINPDSSSKKIEKLQNFLYSLWLYNWEINGSYEDIKDVLILYQIKKWLVTHEDDWGAWYFGKKTLRYLQKDFPDNFEEKARKHLPHEEVQKWKTSFIITAYYSPLPWQRKYITGTYSWDIRLNWGWKVTASWKGVFPGLLAAPKNYEFWTKIYFEGIGIWVVEDRWWAIVNAWDKWHASDRIDVWMWHGDEGLSRAIRWGQRTVQWEILEDFFSHNITFDPSKLTNYYPIRLSPVTSSKSQVVSMQKLFTELWLYSWEIDGKYNSIKDDIIDFQFENGIISSKNVDDAGYIGPKTANFLEKKYPAWIFKEQEKYSFSMKQKKKLDTALKQLEVALKKKAWWNKAKLNIYKSKIITGISKVILATKNKLTKMKLEYLRSKI